MRLILFSLFVISTTLSLQGKEYVVQLIDRMQRTGHPIARVSVFDKDSSLIAQNKSDSSGCFTFKTNESIILLKVDSVVETCEGGALNHFTKVDLITVTDTIKIYLSHYWADRWPNAIFFDEGTLMFTSFPDSTERCDFAHPDPECSGFESLDVLLYEYNLCDQKFSKIEVRTYFTTAEGKQHGNALAIKRAESCINYLQVNGMQNVEFVVTPIPYATRPLKNADGSFRTDEINLIFFRILAW